MTILRNQQRPQSNVRRHTTQITKPVLIVENSESIAKMMSALLVEQWACEVHIAHSYAEAKSYLNKYRYNYHLAICDLVLPDAPGAEIITLLNKAKVQIIAISGNSNPSYIKEIIANGVVDFIDKNNINAYQYTVELVGRLFKNHRIKVLVVDDSKTASQIVIHMLKIQNFQVLTAENGLQALQILKQNNNIKVILTDYSMPEIDGIELTIKVRETHPKESLSIIGISGLDDPELSSQFIKNGANDFLLKPFSYAELLCRVNQNLDMLEHIGYINNLANRDYMTKLYNRRYFFTEGKQLHLSAKNGTPLSVCMMDIDHFKLVNDNYGHDCGDIILIHFAQIMSEHFSGHLAARLGGEEFAVLFKDIEYQKALRLMEQFRIVIEQTPISCAKESITITVSIGANNSYEVNLDSMLKIADTNLYHAKESGRNKVIG
jgi:diguanylate cyclase (GGDEF)-like protein